MTGDGGQGEGGGGEERTEEERGGEERRGEERRMEVELGNNAFPREKESERERERARERERLVLNCCCFLFSHKSSLSVQHGNIQPAFICMYLAFIANEARWHTFNLNHMVA